MASPSLDKALTYILEQLFVTAPGTTGQSLTKTAGGFGWSSVSTPAPGPGIDSTAVHQSEYTGKGVILVGTGVGTYAALAAGVDGQVLVYDSAQASGVKWGSTGSSTPSGAASGVLGGTYPGPSFATGAASPGARVVAASDAPAIVKSAADYVCDGTADEVEINQAIAAASSQGVDVILSPGNFTIHNTINVSDKVHVYGSGQDTTYVKARNSGWVAGTAMFLLNGRYSGSTWGADAAGTRSHGQRLAHMRIDGQNQAIVGVHAKHVDRIMLDDLYLYQCRRGGFKGEECTDSTFLFIRTQYCGSNSNTGSNIYAATQFTDSTSWGCDNLHWISCWWENNEERDVESYQTNANKWVDQIKFVACKFEAAEKLWGGSSNNRIKIQHGVQWIFDDCYFYFGPTGAGVIGAIISQYGAGTALTFQNCYFGSAGSIATPFTYFVDVAASGGSHKQPKFVGCSWSVGATCYPSSGYCVRFNNSPTDVVRRDNAIVTNGPGTVQMFTGSSGNVSWTPTWQKVSGGTTQPSIGNGSITARYHLITPNLMWFNIYLVFGTTTTFGDGDAFELTLPSGFTTAAYEQAFSAYAIDNNAALLGTGHYEMTGIAHASATTLRAVYGYSAVVTVTGTNNASSPPVWTQSTGSWSKPQSAAWSPTIPKALGSWDLTTAPFVVFTGTLALA